MENYFILTKVKRHQSIENGTNYYTVTYKCNYNNCAETLTFEHNQLSNNGTLPLSETKESLVKIFGL